MPMTIDAGTRISALLDEYPFLLETIAGHAPQLARLRNPLLRRTFGRLATLGDAARLGGVSLESLLAAVSEEVRRRTGGTGVTPAEVAPSPPGTGYRVEELKAVLRELHRGAAPEDLRGRFAKLLERVSATEIAEAEQQLVAEGLPEAEIKRLCDVHAAVFRGGPGQPAGLVLPEGSPLLPLQARNRELLAAATHLRELWAQVGDSPAREIFDAIRGELELALDRLGAVEGHYGYKENRLFPLLEKHGIEAPPKVMWAVHDDVREGLRQARAAVAAGRMEPAAQALPELARTVAEMVSKEENILFPMCLEVFDPEDWRLLAAGEEAKADGSPFEVPLPVGALRPEQLDLLFRNLPVDLTYVDADDRVRFYSEGRRIFPRAPEVIGRRVQNCHPPKSVHVVEEIIRGFRAGQRDVAEFWLNYRGRFVHIQYLALRDQDGKYQGILEVVQDATGLRALTGERRLLE